MIANNEGCYILYFLVNFFASQLHALGSFFPHQNSRLRNLNYPCTLKRRSPSAWTWRLTDSKSRNRYCGDGCFFVRGAQNWWYFMPISSWQWAPLMNDGPYNWCSQHGAWGSWISRLEHRAKLICFVRDGRREEGRLLSFRQERSTWCQERRRCSSCCLVCCCSNTTTSSTKPSDLQPFTSI